MGNNKIGIITYHKFNNCGSMLQAYALQRYLELSGYDAEIINYIIKDNKENKISIINNRIKRFLLSKKRKTMIFKMKHSELIKKNKESFEKFYNNYIKLGDKLYNTEEELKKDLPRYDVYMVGSDQMWNPYIKIRSDAFYLSFVPEKLKKVSYAPSIGGNVISEKYQMQMKKYLQKFDFLSCRDKKGCEILSKLLKREVTHVVDPTLLLDENEWKKIESKVEEVEENFILCYFLGNKKENIDFANKLGKEKNCKVYYIYTLANDIIDGNEYLFNVGPQEFIWLIRHAKYVCTDSFHGTIFSINFNKNFYAFTKRKDGEGSDNNRIYGILQEFNLENRLMNNGLHYEIKEINDIEYTEIVPILNEKIERSKEYLSKALK